MRIAPEEAFLAASYDPKTVGGATTTGPQGFGAAEGIVLLLPFVASFFTKFVESIATAAGKKSFAAIVDWLGGDSKQEEDARDKIRQTLTESGMPLEAIDKSTDSIMATLKKLA